MRPTFLGFETCKRGLAVNQKAKDIIGNNITNWDTTGYTRQRVDIVSVAPSNSSTRYGMSKADLAGQGVDMTGISQLRDPYLDKRFREEYGESSYFAQSTEILNDIQSAIKVYSPGVDENSTSGTLGEAISSLADALFNASGEADNDSLANLVAVSAKNMTELLHELSGRLEQVEGQAKFDMGTSVDAYNEYAQKIAALNLVIHDNLHTYGDSEYYAPNELMDQRNLMLDELAKYGDLDIETGKDGMVTIKMNGHTVVSGGKADKINMTREINGTVAIRWNSNGKDATPTTGSLKAYSDYVNGAGPNMDETGETLERGIRYYQDKLDAFARTFVTEMNKVIPVLKTDPDNGSTIPSENEFRVLFGARVETDNGFETTLDMPVTAANIALSDEWLADPSYVIYDPNQNQSKYYLKMAGLLTNSDYPSTFTTSGEKFEGSFLDYINDYAITLGTDISYNSGRQAATATSANTMMDRRDEVSGVNYDEETQSMMVYSKAYQAVARVLTTMDEALDVLINKTGLVGR